MKGKKIDYMRSILWLLASNALVLLVGFFLRPWIARVLGPSEYGLFALILSTSTLVPTFTLFSINSAVLYFIAKNAHRKKLVGEIITTAIAFVSFTSLILFVPLFIVIGIIAPSVTFLPFVAAYFLSFVTMLLYILQSGQQGLEMFGDYSRTIFFSAFVAGVFSLLGASYFKSSVGTVIFRIAGLALVVFIGFTAVKSVGRINYSYLKKMLIYSAPLAVGGLVGSYYAVIDRYFIAHFFTTKDVGFYDISYSLIAAFLPISSALLTIVTPRLIRNTYLLPNYLRRLSSVITLAMTVFGLGIFYFSDIIVTLLLGQEYGATKPIIQILSLSLPFMAYASLNSTVLNSLGKTGLSSFLNILLTILLLGLNIVLTRNYSSIGAAWSNFISFFLVSAVAFFYFSRNYSVNWNKQMLQVFLFFIFAYLWNLIEIYGFIVKASGFIFFVILSVWINYTQLYEIYSSIINSFRNKITRKG